MEIRAMKEFDSPKLMVASASKRDKSRYYSFHRDQGHDVEECIHLKEINCLLKWMLLTKYVKNDRGKKNVDNCPSSRACVINVISGGIAPDGDSNSARKNYATQLGLLYSRGGNIRSKHHF